VTDLRLCAARTDSRDQRFLRRVLGDAASWRRDQRGLSLEELASDPSLARYVKGWGRKGDRGVIAEVAYSPIGAAWWRFFSEHDHGYGFIEPSVPEISIAVAEEVRGRGVGTALLERLVDRANQEGVLALSLSVEAANPALRLYERLGFARVACIDGAWTMRRDTRASRIAD